MKKLKVVLLAAAAVILVGNQTYAQQEHVLTKYGDDVGTLDGIIKAYYDVVCVKQGQKISYERDSLLHIAGVRIGSAGIDPKGNAVLHYTTLKEVHRQSDAYMEKNGYYEKETSRQVRNVRNIYH